MQNNFGKDMNLKNSHPNNERVTTALLLAAGTGSRLYPLTHNAPKCLTMVNGLSILERLIFNLNLHGFKRLLVVTGYLENHIRDFLGNQVGNIKIDYIFSPLYMNTNNIYSLWMARKVINEPFLLLESDLVFDEALLDAMLYPDRMAVAKMQPWMNGSYVTINQSQQVKAFWAGTEDSFGETKYKTVNIYSISLNSWYEIAKRLDKHISAGKVNGYYETVFSEMLIDGSLTFKIVSFDGKPWYEIDTIEDLAKAEKLFFSGNYANTKTATISQPNILDMQLTNAFISPRKQLES
jgi:choline kinase